MTRRRLLVVALLLAVLSVAPLLAPGYFLDAHDGPHSLFFLVEFDNAVRDGALIPRWGADHALGYGYPTFVFYSPLAYYVAEGFHLAGLGITAAVKMTYVLAALLATSGMFLLAESFLGPVAAFVAALAYCFAPYRFVDMYVRSALAESLALALFPWALWGFLSLARRPSARTLALAATAYGALLLAHNVTAILFTPLLVAVSAITIVWQKRWRQWRAWAYTAAAGLLAVGVASFSLLPMLAERGWIVQAQWTQSTYRISDHFVYLSQLLSPFWGYGYAVPGPDDGMSLQLGLVPVALALAGVVFGLAERRTRRPAAFLGLALAGYLLLVLPQSDALWRAFPMLGLAQFPWRLLGVCALLAATLAGVAWRALPGGGRSDWAIALGLLAVVATAAYARPQHTQPSARSETALGIIDFETQHPDMVGITAWVQETPTDSPKLSAYLDGSTIPLAESDVPGATLDAVHLGGHLQVVNADMPAGGQVRFLTYYYPGWHAYVDGVDTPIAPSGPRAVIALDVPAGRHTLAIRFGDTPLRAVSRWITLAAVATLVWLSRLPSSRTPGRLP
ncbi:MAG: 6-pyruvoyl-tetrahydropterin synthase-related protein [Anaerolineae bacterium]